MCAPTAYECATVFLVSAAPNYEIAAVFLVVKPPDYESAARGDRSSARNRRTLAGASLQFSSLCGTIMAPRPAGFSRPGNPK